MRTYRLAVGATGEYTTFHGGTVALVTPNTNVSWEGLTFQTINWTVAGTTGNGINALSVDISMSTDGGLTYPFVIA